MNRNEKFGIGLVVVFLVTVPPAFIAMQKDQSSSQPPSVQSPSPSVPQPNTVPAPAPQASFHLREMSGSDLPSNTIKATAVVQGDSLVILNTTRRDWKNVRVYADCFDDPSNFTQSVDDLDAGRIETISLSAFQRPDGTSFNSGIGNQLDDLLIMCDTKQGKGRWYGMAHK